MSTLLLLAAAAAFAFAGAPQAARTLATVGAALLREAHAVPADGAGLPRLGWSLLAALGPPLLLPLLLFAHDVVVVGRRRRRRVAQAGLVGLLHVRTLHLLHHLELLVHGLLLALDGLECQLDPLDLRIHLGARTGVGLRVHGRPGQREACRNEQ